MVVGCPGGRMTALAAFGPDPMDRFVLLARGVPPEPSEVLVLAPILGFREVTWLTSSADGSIFAWAVLRPAPRGYVQSMDHPVHAQAPPPSTAEGDYNRLCFLPAALVRFVPALGDYPAIKNEAFHISRSLMGVVADRAARIGLAAGQVVMGGAEPLPLPPDMVQFSVEPPGGAYVPHPRIGGTRVLATPPGAATARSAPVRGSPQLPMERQAGRWPPQRLQRLWASQTWIKLRGCQAWYMSWT